MVMMGARGRRSSARLRAAEAVELSAIDAAAAAAEEAAAKARRAAAAAERAAKRARELARQAEVEDSPTVLRDKCRRLARAIRDAKHLVVYTGAGVSTAAAIPDYRGPCGVWTLVRRGEAAPRVDVANATPTLTHRVLAELLAKQRVRFLVSQNCDGLHARAGAPRRLLAELHGNMFLERCEPCGRMYVRAFDTTGNTARGSHGTKRLCHVCGCELVDTIVHFGEKGAARWPLNWRAALRHAARADVLLCLGSSLKVLRRYPRLWSMHRPPHRRPRLYIVNLQWTPKDATAHLKINARCDDVMAQVARRLRLRVPEYRPRNDPLRAHATPLAPLELHTAPPHDRLALSSSSSDSDASDSDDDRPLLALAKRMRAAAAAVRASSPVKPYTSFQVKLRGGGEATIILHSQHSESPSAMARRIVLRAATRCRPHLYSGLHTILAPPPCFWCWRHRRANRCLWYPRQESSRRVFRKVRGARFLCACCPRDRRSAPLDAEAPGWYGKGCRKGRRRR